MTKPFAERASSEKQTDLATIAPYADIRERSYGWLRKNGDSSFDTGQPSDCPAAHASERECRRAAGS